VHLGTQVESTPQTTICCEKKQVQEVEIQPIKAETYYEGDGFKIFGTSPHTKIRNQVKRRRPLPCSCECETNATHPNG